VRAGVRFALRAHICRLAPASDVNWLADSTVEGWHFSGSAASRGVVGNEDVVVMVSDVLGAGC
jgi:hypothetical protein